jgi:YesN/AraC family two-component response regulator
LDSIGKFAVPVVAVAESGGEDVAVADGNQEKPLILIVEDNLEVARFIAAPLKRKYQVQFAENGRIGIEKAMELVPDLVISDVMMPEKDGFEVCQALKTDERTSHIPVIMLTAKAEAQDRLKGLRRGADAYLSKPFDEEELLVNIERSLKLRQVLQRRYAGLQLPTSTAPLQEEALSEYFDVPIEDAFLQRVISEIQDNLSDSNFGAAELCRKLTLSSSQMHRKLKAVTDETPIDIIRKLRLNKAKEMLRNTGKNISEIGVEVGFDDPAYFSRVFTKEFGVSPSEFQKQR